MPALFFLSNATCLLFARKELALFSLTAIGDIGLCVCMQVDLKFNFKKIT